MEETIFKVIKNFVEISTVLLISYITVEIIIEVVKTFIIFIFYVKYM